MEEKAFVFPWFRQQTIQILGGVGGQRPDMYSLKGGLYDRDAALMQVPMSHPVQIETPKTRTSKFLPTTAEEMAWRGWTQLDVILVTGDAYIDHPSFGMAALGRLLESWGLKVGILPQPRWDRLDDFLSLGRPRLFFGVSAGTVDSMINNYTANKKPRSDDMYSEGGVGGHRPDHATVVYAKKIREAFPDALILAGGVEVSLRRLAHYDYWQNRVRPSILTELASDLMVFGMGERPLKRVIEELSSLPGLLSRDQADVVVALDRLKRERGFAYLTSREEARGLEYRLTLPSFEEVRDDRRKFAKAAYFIEYEASPYNGRKLVQYHGSKAVVINSPSLPLTEGELDQLYTFPYTKEAHPRYRQKIPAAEMIRFSIASTRGCFGGCSFCAITLHQGRIVQSRSEASILGELAAMPEVPGFTGVVSDIGGPTANMYQLRCKGPEVQSKCRKLSCVHPKICPHLQSDHEPQVKLLEKARRLKGIKKIRISSGLRYDLALHDKKSGRRYLKDLISHHVGGQLKVAPEHLSPEVLHLMKKPSLACFDEFRKIFETDSKAAGKEQYLVPYFISAFPGTTHEQMAEVTDYMTREGWNLQQVQSFIPTPMTLATAMYWTGIDPMTKKELFVPKEGMDRKVQQALLQPQKPENAKLLQNYKGGVFWRRIRAAKAEAARRKQKKQPIVPGKVLGPQLYLDQR